MYRINYEKLSSDKLLEIWLYQRQWQIGKKERMEIEAILTKREVIKKVE